MAENRELVQVSADDWSALYLNGEICFQGHSIPDFVWLEFAPGCTSSKSFELVETAKEDLERIGRFPSRFEEIRPTTLIGRDSFPSPSPRTL